MMQFKSRQTGQGMVEFALILALVALIVIVALIATGGQAALVAGLTNVIETTDPLLTLEGLRLIYAQNSDGDAKH